jgi:muconate cycloisomerase
MVNGEFFEGGVAAIKRYLRPAIEGLRLGEWDSLIRKMHRVVVSTSAGSVFKSALEAACWDAWAKVLEVPLCQLWSGKPPSKARLAYSLVGETSQAIAASFALGKEAGYTHFHIHLGARIELDDAILEALLGLKIKPERLLITLDQSRTLTQTRAVLRRIQPSGMHVAVPSELKHTEWSDELCHLLKPMLAGPYETLRRWDGGTVPVISLQWESAIGTALGIQLAMAMGQDSIIINHGLTHVDSPYVAKESLAVENGMVSIGPDNGLGLGVSDDAVRSLATEIF